jgi:hypothetical protein
LTTTTGELATSIGFAVGVGVGVGVEIGVEVAVGLGEVNPGGSPIAVGVGEGVSALAAPAKPPSRRTAVSARATVFDCMGLGWNTAQA